MSLTPPLVARLVTAEFVAALLVFPTLLMIPAPYGRYRRPGFGPMMPARLAWVLMELPAVVVPVWAFLAAGGASRGPVPWLLLALWELHYVQRTFVFPFAMRGRRATKPVLTAALAVLFNVVNGVGNGASLAWRAESMTPLNWLGVALFLAGLATNLHADHILRTLRRPGEDGYRIPRGGAFRWVSAANYFGELVEWTGFALAAMTPAAWAFAAFTAANLVPRAITHHKWYRATFPDYPVERRAVVPFLL
ncbi:MAG TPA: DUF1295 domain-containing protein [Gemmatimonadales bacterium]|nr:DUF1295 domain-containing protein [Gemmatimonadales bacterium]